MSSEQLMCVFLLLLFHLFSISTPLFFKSWTTRRWRKKGRRSRVLDISISIQAEREHSVVSAKGPVLSVACDTHDSTRQHTQVHYGERKSPSLPSSSFSSSSLLLIQKKAKSWTGGHHSLLAHCWLHVYMPSPSPLHSLRIIPLVHDASKASLTVYHCVRVLPKPPVDTAQHSPQILANQ